MPQTISVVLDDPTVAALTTYITTRGVLVGKTLATVDQFVQSLVAGDIAQVNKINKSSTDVVTLIKASLGDPIIKQAMLDAMK